MRGQYKRRSAPPPTTLREPTRAAGSDRRKRHDLHERVVQPASAAPICRLFAGQEIDGVPCAAGVHETAERHPGNAGSDTFRHAAERAHLTSLVANVDVG